MPDPLIHAQYLKDLAESFRQSPPSDFDGDQDTLIEALRAGADAIENQEKLRSYARQYAREQRAKK
jgi:hypothetical protein